MDEYRFEAGSVRAPQTEDCPACGREIISGHSECYSCGIVISHFVERNGIEKTKSEIGGIDHLGRIDLQKLEKMWKQVVVNYHDQQTHHDFLKFCQSKSAIPFAVYQYSKILEIDKDDDIAPVMRRQALSRLTQNFTVVPSAKEKLFAQTQRLIRWTSVVGFLVGFAFVSNGLVDPSSRNLIGLGVAIMSLNGFLYYSQRR